MEEIKLKLNSVYGKIKNKEIIVDGYLFNGITNKLLPKKLHVLITNDERGKTISIDNGIIQYTIPFEPLEEYLK